MNKIEMEQMLLFDGNVEIQMPNEIFEDFIKADFKSFNHRCYGYAYYYLNSYIYRNALYQYNPVAYSQHNLIMSLTGNKSVVSYITKKGGLLDDIGYTRSTTDYPIATYITNDILEFKGVKAHMKQMDGVYISSMPKLAAKIPLKAIFRFDDENFTGTFYSFQNTHKFSLDRFIKIISDGKLGHVGLFLYGYILMMCDKYPKGFEISDLDLSKVVGCCVRTIKTYTKQLSLAGVIRSERTLFNQKQSYKAYFIVNEG